MPAMLGDRIPTLSMLLWSQQQQGQPCQQSNVTRSVDEILFRTGSYETLEAVVRRDRRRLGALLGYVRYALNPALQAEAVRLGHHLSARLPAIVDYLIQPNPGAS